ncbi:DUF4197 domain-containing protein [Hydrotalea sp.]|uniref:DUF4197 domain-containing protein n=1 Tax=Hydrotalea sp. TaxID=2881279 RepID=UPI00258CD3D5|nr:DUF4197 domain-containing protein [Hydrotalea sp.]
MKLILVFLSFFCFSIFTSHAQLLKGLLKNNAKDSSVANGVAALGNLVKGNGSGTGLSKDDIIDGLKQALEVGANKSVTQLSSLDGYFKNNAIKILMPPEAQKVENTLRNMGLGNEVDNAILTMNRAAEDAAKSAAPIFVNAIKGMTIQDGMQLLKGGDSAATHYLREKTTASLTTSFKPIVEQSLVKVDATKYWNSVFSTYNKVPFVKKINPDLTGYVTEKALDGLFYQVAQEEQKIRKDPVARTTDLLKKVFAQ